MKIADLQKADKHEYVLKRMVEQGFPKERLSQELIFAQQIVMGNDYLSGLIANNANSLLESILQVVACGLTLNPAMKQCYLVPFKNIVKPMPSYVGLQQLVIKSGAVSHIRCQLVWEGDEVEMDLSDEENPIKNHKPYVMTGKEKGEILFVYAVATLGNGAKLVEYMSRLDVLEIRSYSESYSRAVKNKNTGSTIWEKHEGEMFRKTVVKRLCKRLPLTYNATHIADAIQLDNEASGFDDEASFAQMGYIESLIQSCTLPEHVINQLESEKADGLTQMQATRMIAFLKDNQDTSTARSMAGVNAQISYAEEKDDMYERRGR